MLFILTEYYFLVPTLKNCDFQGNYMHVAYSKLILFWLEQSSNYLLDQIKILINTYVQFFLNLYTLT